ncbi:hypothetical protein [Salibacter halophilus]|uniref:Lipoprotein n=1 Tax=Salibacter halophilus TaxID=1803916 RepID=A0A6N6M1B9_9FLAO|nr:hypothetical protein [Salibacter halophilus]KAB1061473.1 hypothetical protein F3059_13530 [Salibacter halophilus]
MKQIEQSWKMIKSLTVIGLLIFLSSCSNTQRCNELEQKIIDICVKKDSTYTIPLASLTNFEWDTLYVISGPTVDNEAGDIIGIDDYKKLIPDGSRQYIFIKRNKIVKEYSSYCSLNLSGKCLHKENCKYLDTSIIQVEKQEGEGHFIYRLEER